MKLFNIPGAVWVSLIVMVTSWLNTNFPDQPWLPATVVALGAIAKLIQMYWPKKAPETPIPAGQTAPDGTISSGQAATPPKPSPAVFFLG